MTFALLRLFAILLVFWCPGVRLVASNSTFVEQHMRELNHTVALFRYTPELLDLPPETLLSQLPTPLKWQLDDVVHYFWPQCGTVELHNKFELAWAQYIDLHHKMTQGQLPPRFVHIAFPPEASLQTRIKVIVSSVLLGMLTDRATVVSWVPSSINEGFGHVTLLDLFRSPGFDWWYMPNKYNAAHFDRFNVRGFGQEDPETVTHEPNELMCSDLANDRTPWLEMHWKYDSFGGAIFHNPFLHARAANLFGNSDFFGPIARKLFFPTEAIWKRITKLYRRYYDKSSVRRKIEKAGANDVVPALYVVGVELHKTGDSHQIRQCLASRGLKNRQQPVQMSTHHNAQTVRVLRYFVSAPLLGPKTTEEVVKFLGNDRVFRYDNSDLLNPPGKFTSLYPSEERELIEEFLMQFSDVVFVPRNTERSRHWLFSQKPVVFDGDTCQEDVQCQPCFNWKMYELFPCFTPQIKERMVTPIACSHSLWYRW